MASTCECNVGLRNTRLPDGCVAIGSVTERLIFVPTFDGTGARNFINLATANLDSTYWNALVNNTDKTLRYYPIESKFENVETERGDSVYDEFDSGLKFFVEKGIKSFMGLLPKANPALLGFFETARCTKMSVFLVDSNGSILGNGSEYGKLYPFRIADGTLDSKDVSAKDKSVQRLAVRFDFDETEQDEDVKMILSSEMNFDIKTLRGLYDAQGSFTSITTTGFVVDVFTPYGTAKNRLMVTGLVAGDFTLKKVDGTAVTITSSVENTTLKGKYTFVIPSQSSGTKMRLTFAKAGYDSSVLGSRDIIVP